MGFRFRACVYFRARFDHAGADQFVATIENGGARHDDLEDGNAVDTHSPLVQKKDDKLGHVFSHHLCELGIDGDVDVGRPAAELGVSAEAYVGLARR